MRLSAGSRPPRVYLPADSFVFTAIEQDLLAGRAERAQRVVERALEYVESDQRGRCRLLLGRCRIATGHPAQAADDLMTLALAESDRERAAEALYYVAVAHERMDRADVAATLYRELLQREDLPAELRSKAEAGVRRVGD
jgi:tetratricopeptide (TPR) repeat protein